MGERAIVLYEHAIVTDDTSFFWHGAGVYGEDSDAVVMLCHGGAKGIDKGGFSGPWWSANPDTQCLLFRTMYFFEEV